MKKKGTGFWLRNKSLARFMSVLVSVSMILSLLPAQGVQEARSEFLMATAIAQEDPKTNETTDPGGGNTNNSSSSAGSSSTNEGNTPTESQPEGEPEPTSEPEPTNQAPANNSSSSDEQSQHAQSSSSSSSSETPEPAKTPQGANLADFITKAEIKDADDKDVEEKDGVLQVKEEQKYIAKLTFTEKDEKQFATEGELAYKLPAGFTPAAEQPAAKEALFITYVDDNSERQPIELGKESWWIDGDTVHMVWKVRDADKRSPEEVAQALATVNELTSVEFELSIAGTFAAGTESVDFGAPTEPIALEVEAAKKDDQQKSDEQQKSGEEQKKDDEQKDEESESKNAGNNNGATASEEEQTGLTNIIRQKSILNSQVRSVQSITTQAGFEGALHAQEDTNLASFLTDATINAPKNDQGVYQVNPGQSYNISLFFAEQPDGIQFPTPGTEMEYTITAQIENTNGTTGTFTINVTDTSTGQVYAVPGNTYSVSGNTLKVTFNPNAQNIDKLLASANARFNVSFTGTIKEDATQIPFSDNVNKQVHVDNSSDVTVTGPDDSTNSQDVTVEVTDGKSNTVTVDNLMPGVYTVTEDTSKNPNGMSLLGEKSKTVTVYSQNKKDGETVVETAEFTNTKPGTPGFDKKIKDTNDTTGETSDWQDSADYDIGDAVPYKLTATLPKDVTTYKKYHITFTDKMENSLTYNKDAKITVTSKDGKPIPASEYTVTKVAENDHDFGYTLTWTGNDGGLITNEALNGAKVEVEFTATLNSDAVLGKEGNVNACKLAYSNNPTSEDDKDEGELPWDYVIAFTYKLDISKVNENSRPLKGAEFKLQKKIADGDPKDIELTVDESTLLGGGNTFTATGLDDGTYILTETVAPEGYKKIDPIEFTVKADHNATWDYTSDAASDPVFDNDGIKGSKRLGVLTSLTGDVKDSKIELKADDKMEGLKGDVVHSKGGASVVVRKRVTSSRTEDKTRNYKFKITLYKDKYYKEVYKTINGKYGDMEFKDGVANFTLKHDESKEASKLPITKDGIYYKVEETDSGDLTPSMSNPRKSLDGYTHTVTCTNSYKSGTPKRSTSSRLATARTGDNTNSAIVIALVGIGVVGVVAGVLYRRRRMSE